MTEIGQAPANLCAQISFIAERQDRVAICLTDCIAVTLVCFRAGPIGIDDPAVRDRMMLLNPTQQRGAKIETDVRVIIDGSRPVTVLSDRNSAVRLITFRMNAFVPIVERRGARLLINGTGPWIFPGGLVKVAVDDQRWHLGVRRLVAAF